MFSNRHILSLCCGTLLYCGCTTLYRPQLAEVPLIDHKGDIRVSLQGDIGIPYMQCGSTISWGVTDALALQMHGSTNFADYYTHFAAGLYRKMSTTAFEGYVGLGFGKGEKWNGEDIYYTTAGHYVLPFVQFNYGLHNVTKTHIDAGLALKAGVMIPNFIIHYRYPYTNVVTRNYQQTNLLLEPQFFFRIGTEHVRYSIQAGYSYLNNMYSYHDPHIYGRNSVYYWPVSFSIGVMVYL